MVCITCKMLSSSEALKPYKGYEVLVRTPEERKQVDRYFKELGIEGA